MTTAYNISVFKRLADYLRNDLYDERLTYCQAICSSGWIGAVITKSMTEKLISYIKREGLINTDKALICLNCYSPFVCNSKVCNCYSSLVECHNYMFAASYKHFPDFDDILNKLKQQIRSSRNIKARRQAEGFFSKSDISKIYEMQAGLCYYCMCPISFTNDSKLSIDHIEPLSEGGSNWPDNLALTCNDCNRRKSWLSESEFIKRIRKDRTTEWISEHKEFLIFIKRHKRKCFD